MPNRPDDLVVSVEPRKDGGATLTGPGCQSFGPQPASPFSRSGIPSAEKSGIWDYAKAMGKTMHAVAPADLYMEFPLGSAVRISATITSTQEAEAMREIIRELSAKLLTSHRPMVRADVYGPPPPKPPFSARLEAMFGTAQGTSAGTAETHSGSGRQPAGPGLGNLLRRNASALPARITQEQSNG